MKFSRRHKGSITIFLLIVMCPMLIFGMSVVDIAKIFFTQNTVSTAGQMAINSGLSTYDKVLKDVYGLIATSATEEELTEKINMYYLATLNSTGINDKNNSNLSNLFNGLFQNSNTNVANDNLIRVTTEQPAGSEGIKTARILESGIANPDVMKRQIVEYMKYRGPVSIGTGILEKLNCLGDLSHQTAATTAKINFEENLEQIEKRSDALYTMLNEYLTHLEEMNKLNDQTAKCLVSAFVMGSGCSPWSSDNFEIDSLTSFSKQKVSSSVKEEIKKIKDKDRKKNDDEDSEEIDADEEIAIEIYTLADDKNKEVKKILSDWDNYINKCNENKSTLSLSYDKLLELKATEYAGAAYNLFENVYNSISDNQALLDYWYILNEAHNVKDADYIANDMCEISDKISDVKSIYDQMYNYYKKILKNGLDYYESSYNGINESLDSSKSIIKKIEDIQSAIEKAKINSEEWSNNNKLINTSSVKGNMESQHMEETAALKDIDEEEIQYLKDLITSQRSNLESAKSAFKEILYCDEKLVDGLSNLDKVLGWVSTKSMYNPGDINTQSANYSASQLKTDCYFSNENVIRLFNAPDKVKETKLYKFLEDKCQTTNNTASDDIKKKAESTKKEINEVNSSYETPEGPMVSTSVLKETQTFNQQYSANQNTAQNSTYGQISDIKAGKTDGAKSALNDVGLMFDELEKSLVDGLESLRDDLYIAQYIQEMFTSVSYDKFNHDQGNIGKSYDSTPSGYCKNPYNNYYAGAEVEYILYGNEDIIGANVAGAAATIFGIRFVLNLIYSFTDSEINTLTTEIATALVGWTGFGVPILKTILHIGLALGESAIDIAQLLDGQSVPIFKTTDTWTCKPSGVLNTVKKEAINTLIKTAKTEAAKIVNSAADALTEKVNKLAESGQDVVSGTKEEVDKLVAEQINLMRETAKSEVFNPLNDLIVSCSGKTTEFVTAQVKTKLSNLKSLAEKNSSGELGKIEVKMVEYLESESVVNKIVAKITAAPNQIYNQASETVFYFEDLYNETLDEVSDTINDVTEKVREGINNTISEIASDINNGINSGKEKIKSSINGALDEINLGEAEDTPTGNKSIKATLLSMNYNEYLFVFLMLNLMGGEAQETAILERTAKLININISYTAENADKTCSSLPDTQYLMSKLIDKKSGYNINNAVTIIQVGMEADVQTLFLGSIIQSNGINFSGINDKKYRLVYNGVGGY